MAANAVKTCGAGIAGLLLALAGARAAGEVRMSAGVDAVGGAVPAIDREAHPRTERAVFALG